MPNHTPPQSDVRRGSVARSVLISLTAVGVAVAPSAASAQDGGPRDGGSLELRPFAGVFLPTGAQHELLSDAFHLGGQLSYRVAPAFAITGTLAWSPTKDRRLPDDPALDVIHYDAGVEGRAPSWLRGTGWDFVPFLGLGLGGRTYRFEDLGTRSQSKLAGYGAVGGELGFRRLGVRIEARDYLSRFSPLTGRGASDTRNDVTLALGITLRP